VAARRISERRRGPRRLGFRGVRRARDGRRAEGDRRLHRLRRAVRDVFGAVADQTDIPEPGWIALRRAAAEAVAAVRLDRRGDHGHPSWELDSLDALGRPLAYAALDLLTSGPLDRVKRCPACPWI
jgi:predicted RNA-binding Zn ribbon-like protein